ncbi:MAG: respiratory nitrate reductase subunit gamma [Chloroflexi bacterium]|nr:respiratory nitrate reductase subunit gamma [Chloroflexota bacterium]
MSNLMLFAVFPYVATILAVLVGIYRYFSDRYSYSSQSSQFLENRVLFWGSVPWHYGIITILLVHIVAAIVPGAWGQLLGVPWRLAALEVTGFAVAVFTLLGLALLIIRRLSTSRIHAVTTGLDWVLLAALLVQVGLGCWIALFYRWGGAWYVQTAAPWLVSLVTLHPQVDTVTALPGIVKLHLLGGFLIVALFPFTRLVHLVTFPVTYLWRPHQVVVWNRRPGTTAAFGGRPGAK